MKFPVQKTFGQFVAERYGPKWVYVARTSDRIKWQYPNSTVITPKQQRQLREDYRRNWGSEYDPAAWQALCALRAVVAEPSRDRFAPLTKNMVRDAIEALTT